MQRVNLTDRAYRYRAQRTPPHGPKRCAFCGSTRNVVPDHIDGHEENGAPDNLMWLCKSCNNAKGIAMRNSGIGRLTHQYNPTKSGGAATVGEWMRAVGSIIPHKGAQYSGENYGLVAAMPVHEAVQMIRATPAHRRSEFASKLRRHNPVAKSKFDKCVEDVTRRGTAADPRAVCATAGRKKYGQAEMTRRAIAGKRRAARTRGNLGGPYAKRETDAGWEIIDTRTGSVVRTAKTKSAALQIVTSLNGKFVARGMGQYLRNPADAAAQAYEKFHGEPPSEFITITEKIHRHGNLWSLGDLKLLVIRTVDEKYEVKLKQFKGAILAANEQAFEELSRTGKARAQLFIKGGDQSIDLEDFGIDPDRAHEVETLGRAVRVDYETNKIHLGDEGGEAVYAHKFRTTREGDAEVRVRWARYPDVIYRVLDQHLELSGGSYELIAEGINL